MSRPKLELSGTQLVASALATTTAAIAASKLGSVGTLWGAAVTSLLTTGGAAIYKHYLDQGRERVTAVIEHTDHATTGARLEHAPAGTTGLDVPAADRPSVDLRDEPATAWWRRRRLALLSTAVAVFALVMGGITVAERVMGNSVAGVVNNEQADRGTWGGGFTRPDPKPSPARTSQTPSPSTTPSGTPSSTPPTSPPATSEPTTPAPSTPAPTQQPSQAPTTDVPQEPAPPPQAEATQPPTGS
ncbi:hypothetical protein GCM10027589_53300 [Actinocorallia lasiicapitis]